MSPYLASELRIGDPLELRGPIGGYFTWTVAEGGPALSDRRWLRRRAVDGDAPPPRRTGERNPGDPALFGASAAEDIIFQAELDRLVTDGNCRVVYTLTRSQPTDWTGYRRRIDLEMLSEVIGPPPQGGIAYVCGPTALVEGVASTLVGMGYAADRVRTERFGPTGG